VLTVLALTGNSANAELATEERVVAEKFLLLNEGLPSESDESRSLVVKSEVSGNLP
jgi:hypothetical protein